MRPDNLKLRIVSNGEKFRVEAWGLKARTKNKPGFFGMKDSEAMEWCPIDKEGRISTWDIIDHVFPPAEFSTRNAALGWIKQKFGETALDHAVVPAEWRP